MRNAQQDVHMIRQHSFKDYLASLFLLSIVFLPACTTTPYSLSINKINEDGPQREAAITLSDPQIYQRETLINDRLREAKLIQKLLEESESIGFGGETTDFRDEFQPQIIREAEAYSSLVAGLNANFNSDLKDSSKQEKEIARLRHQMEVLKLNQELEELKRLIKESNESASLPKSNKEYDGNITDDTTADESSNETEEPVASTIDDSQQNDVEAEETSILDSLTKKVLERISGASKANPSSVTATPRDRFRDLQAYRSELRHELAALNLDDLHDNDGNALYRMQFKATVMPGEHKDKFGVVKLDVKAAEIEEEDKNRLYYSWLNHISYRLNLGSSKNRDLVWQQRYASLESAGLFDLALIRYCESNDARILCKKMEKGKLRPTVKYITETSDFIECFDSKYAGSCFLIALPYNSLEIGTDCFKDGAIRWLSINDLKCSSVDYLVTTLRQLSQNNNFRENYRKNLSRAAMVVSSGLKKVVESKLSAPKSFTEQIDVALGKAYIYAATPVELSQRISTVGRSAKSMELALGIAASLPTKGIVESEFNSKYINAAVGNIEAQERVPLVVGFSNAEIKDKNSNSSAGWVFGPSTQVNLEDDELELTQRVANFDVALDISVPGWWPKIQFSKRTVWVGNWHENGDIIKEVPGSDSLEKGIEINLPQNRANLDGLTDYLANRKIGRFTELLKIDHIEPYYIPACTKDISILIKGVNVWRSTEVFLGSVKSEHIRVLPDMEGVEAKFDLDKFYATTNIFNQKHGANQKTKLVVWTRNGSDSKLIGIEGTRVKKANQFLCSSPFSVARSYAEDEIAILEAVPKSINNCKVDKSIVVKLSSVLSKNDTENKAKFYLNGFESKPVKNYKSNKTPQLVFDEEVSKLLKTNRPALLTVTDDEWLYSLPIPVESCEAEKKPPTLTLKHVLPKVIGKVDGKKIEFDASIKLVEGGLVHGYIRLGLTVAGLEQRKQIVSSTFLIPDIKEPKTLVSKFVIKNDLHNGDVYRLLASGRKLNLSLLIYKQSNPTVLEHKIKIPNNLVFYKKGDELIKISPAKNGQMEVELDIKFAYPNNYKSAFTDIKSISGIKARIDKTTVGKLSNYDLAVKLTKNKDTISKIKLSLINEIQKKEFEAYRKLPEAKKKDIKIMLEFIPTKKDVPKISSFIIEKVK